MAADGPVGLDVAQPGDQPLLALQDLFGIAALHQEELRRTGHAQQAAHLALLGDQFGGRRLQAAQVVVPLHAHQSRHGDQQHHDGERDAPATRRQARPARQRAAQPAREARGAHLTAIEPGEQEDHRQEGRRQSDHREQRHLAQSGKRRQPQRQVRQRAGQQRQPQARQQLPQQRPAARRRHALARGEPVDAVVLGDTHQAGAEDQRQQVDLAEHQHGDGQGDRAPDQQGKCDQQQRSERTERQPHQQQHGGQRTPADGVDLAAGLDRGGLGMQRHAGLQDAQSRRGGGGRV